MDILIDTIIDTLKLVPFLFVSFILMEVIEHKLNNKKILEKTNKFGPIVGSLLENSSGKIGKTYTGQS